MYFSAACLIGMRPLLSRLPEFIKTRVLNASGKRGGTYELETDKLRFRRSLNGPYTNVQGEEVGLRGQGHTPLHTAVNSTPYARDPFVRDISRRDILVKTNIEVRRDPGRSHP